MREIFAKITYLSPTQKEELNTAYLFAKDHHK
jgi:hypothetical protein